MQLFLGDGGTVSDVSIRAPRCRGAMPGGSRCALRLSQWFQSAPLVAEGRCVPGTPGRVRYSMFQSAPLVAEGRCLSLWRWTPLPWQFQSAPLVAEGRCFSLPVALSLADSFNPRPSLPRGDARPSHLTRIDVSVSIRAPRCRGAMPWGYDGKRGNWWFQSAPLVAEGRCGTGNIGRFGHSGFQSAPLVAEGRCAQRRSARQGTYAVSIRAPRCRGAMPPVPP